METLWIVAGGQQQLCCRVRTNAVQAEHGREVLFDDRPQASLDVGDLGFEKSDPLRQQLQRDTKLLFNEVVVAGAEADCCVQLVSERLGREHVTEAVRSAEHHRLELIDRLDAVMSR